MIYTKASVLDIHDKSFKHAIMVLRGLDIARNRPPTFKGLNGWIFEQTIRSCLEDEFKAYISNLSFRDQVKLNGRASADLLVGKAAIEIKAGGLFADASDKYIRYRNYANQLGYEYLYITREETYAPYAIAAIKAFGRANTFFLTDEDSWEAFVKRIALINNLNVYE